MDRALISVIIICKNCEDTISKSIESVLSQKYPIEKIEVIVVDGNSTDRTLEIVSQYPVRLLIEPRNNPKPNPSKARNLGAKSAKGEYLFFMDGDCFMERRCVEKVISRYSDDKVGMVGVNCVKDASGNYISRCWHFYQSIVYKYRMPKERFLSSRFVTIRRDLFWQISGFDESLSSGEDVDLSQKVLSLGYKIIDDQETNIHHDDKRMQSLKGMFKLYCWYGESKPELWRRYGKTINKPFKLSIILNLFLINPIPLLFSIIVFFEALKKTKNLAFSLNCSMLVMIFPTITDWVASAKFFKLH